MLHLKPEAGGEDKKSEGAFKRKSPWYSSFGSRQFGKKPKLAAPAATNKTDQADDEEEVVLSKMTDKSLRIDDDDDEVMLDHTDHGEDHTVVKKRNKCFLQSPRIGSDVSQDSGLGEEVMTVVAASDGSTDRIRIKSGSELSGGGGSIRYGHRQVLK